MDNVLQLGTRFLRIWDVHTGLLKKRWTWDKTTLAAWTANFMPDGRG